jgi:predicted Zn-dependent peptidase
VTVDRSRLPEVGADPPFTFPVVVRHVLPNGLRVWTVEHPSVPVVTFALQVEGGSSADPAGGEGLSAMVADMLDEGTGALTAIEVSEALAGIGADLDVDVGGDATLVSLTTLTRFAARGAALLADIASRPSIRVDDFERVRQLRLDRLRQLKDVASALADSAFLRVVYGPHPYGHLPLGTDGTLRTVTLEHVAAWHAAFYRPARATLIACGALGHDELLRLAAEAFGGWTASQRDADEARSPLDIAVPHRPSARLAVVPRDAAPQSELRIGLLTTTRVTPDYAALLVMNAVLGGQFVSRVNLKLREEKGYTYGARTSFDWRRGISPFVLQTSVHTAITAEAIADSVAEIGAIAASRPPTADELALAKASLTRGYPRGFETAQQVSRAVTQMALYGLPESYFSEFVARVNAVTGDEVVEAAARRLQTAQLAVVVVGDLSAISEPLLALGMGAPQILPPEL